MRVCRWLAVLALLLCSGCRGLRGTSPADALPGDALTEREIAFLEGLSHYAQALVHERERGVQSTDAVDHYLHAIEHDPARTQLYTKTAFLYLRQRRFDDAIAILTQACDRNPESIEARRDLAFAYEATGKPKQAAEQYEKTIRLGPRRADLYCQTATVYYRLSQDVDAEAVLRRGLKKTDRPGVILLYAYNAGLQFMEGEKPERAIACLELVTRNTSLKGRAFYKDTFVNLATLYLKRDPAKAVDTLRRADAIMPGELVILSALGFVYTHEERFAEAADAFRQAESAAEAGASAAALNENFYLYYGAAYERSGQFDRAAEVFERCIERFPDAHQILNYLAYMWAEQGTHLEKAAKYVGRALSHEQENGAYVDTLGWILYKQEKHQRALIEIERANELVPNDATIVDHLGDVNEALGKPDRALEHWRRSFVLDPGNEAVATKLEARGVDLEPLRKQAEERKAKKKQDAGDAAPEKKDAAP